MNKPNGAFYPSSHAFANLLNDDVVKLLASANKIGGQVLQISKFVQQGFVVQHWLLTKITQTEKPDTDGMAEILKPLNEVFKKAAEMTEGNSSVFSDHLNAAALSLYALKWIEHTGIGMSNPVECVEDYWQVAEVFCNKVLLKYRDKNLNHVEWAKALRELYRPGLRDYVESFYPLGPIWSSGSSQASSSKPKEGMSAGSSMLKRQTGCKWVVEDQIGEQKGLVINDYDSKQSVFLHGCNNSVMQIQDVYNIVTGKVDNGTTGKDIKMDVVFKDDPASGIVKTDIKIAYEDPKKKVEAESERRGGSCDDVSLKAPSMRWGQCYRFEELHVATCGFAKGTVIGEGKFGVVYIGVLQDGSLVAVKKLKNERQAESDKEFMAEVEALGKVRHKNLLDLFGYCTEGPQRMLVYKHVDNGNLEQWLHGDVGDVSPLTWEIRMKIAFGTATGLAYLHTGLEPRIVHRDIKSSNVLLDKDWNAIVSDLGLAKLLHSEQSHASTRVVGTFGYVAPEYARTGQLNEASDVYSFGVLFMEIISGRRPIDRSRPHEVFVDWFKEMVASHRGKKLVDPLIEVPPSKKSLERALKLCVECTNFDVSKRPKMDKVARKLQELGTIERERSWLHRT